MNDLEIAVIGVVLSFLAAVWLWYAVEDELERLWHVKELKRLKGKRR